MIKDKDDVLAPKHSASPEISFILASQKAEEGKGKIQAEAIAEYNRFILDAYKKKFKPEPKKDKEDNPTLTFGSPEKAHQFFKELAKKGVPFFAYDVDSNGNPSGNYKMSYGDGILHEGKVEPDNINQIRQEFLDKIKESVAQNKQNTTGFKQRMTQIKDDHQTPLDAPQQTSSTTQASVPNPFDTNIPKPK